jgi:glycosyltransferase involved in cell wall biosynthesis
MRILHVTDTYGPRIGGIEILVRGLAARQAEAGHDVTVLTSTMGPNTTRGDQVQVCRDPGRMRDLVDRSDVVHAHLSAYSPLAVKAAETAAGRGLPVVAVVHSLWGSAWPLFRAAALLRGWGDRPIQMAAVSEAAAGPVRRALPGRHVLVLPNAIEVKQWAASPRDRVDNVVTLVAVMRMTRRKRPLPLLRLLREVRSLAPSDLDLRVRLIGEGPLHGAVTRAISRPELQDWVTAPGALNQGDIQRLYRDADVFLAPATLESFGIAALEARAAGLAVVARAGTGVGDFVTHGVNGLLASSDTQMVQQLAQLCANPSALRAIADHNRATVPAHDWSDVLWRNEYAYAAAADLVGARSHGDRSQGAVSDLGLAQERFRNGAARLRS